MKFTYPSMDQHIFQTIYSIVLPGPVFPHLAMKLVRRLLKYKKCCQMNLDFIREYGHKAAGPVTRPHTTGLTFN